MDTLLERSWRPNSFGRDNDISLLGSGTSIWGKFICLLVVEGLSSSNYGLEKPTSCIFVVFSGERQRSYILQFGYNVH